MASFIADGLIASRTTVYKYDLVSGGGASGSPILDEKGEFIAINFTGNTKDADTEFGYGVIGKGLRDLLASPRRECGSRFLVRCKLSIDRSITFDVEGCRGFDAKKWVRIETNASEFGT